MSYQYIYCTNNVLEVRETTPYINLAFRVFGGGFKTNSKTVNYIEGIIDILLKTLTDREQEILTYRVGLNGKDCQTLEQIGNHYGFTDERIRQIESKALRKMRHPSRSRILRGHGIHIDYSSRYNPLKYSEGLGEILRQEIQCVIKGSSKETLYLNNIMQRNNMRIINLANKACEEVEIAKEYVDCYGADDGYNSILFENGCERAVFKYSGNDTKKIANSLMNIICNQSGMGSDILHSSFSPGLKQILLLKGYLYENSVYDDADILQEQLTAVGFGNYANEISALKKLNEINTLESEEVYLRKINDDISELIIENNCSSVDEFIQVAGKLGNQEAMIIAEEIKQNIDVEKDCEN